MKLKNKIKNQGCAHELEEMIIDYIKAGFFSNDTILIECEQYIKDFYHKECADITKKDLLKMIQGLRKKFQNTGNQENFFKLDLAFHALKKHGIVALHYAGYTQSDGFEDCNEIATQLYQKGERVIGCCFYTEQDLGHILYENDALFYFSFGNYFEKPTAEQVGQIIVDELKNAGFCIQWDGTAKTKIAIKNFKWDKYYTEEKSIQ